MMKNTQNGFQLHKQKSALSPLHGDVHFSFSSLHLSVHSLNADAEWNETPNIKRSADERKCSRVYTDVIITHIFVQYLFA